MEERLKAGINGFIFITGGWYLQHLFI